MKRESKPRVADVSLGAFVAFITVAVGSGAIGGFIHSAFAHGDPAQASAAQVLRTHAVEIVDSSGKLVAYLGTDEKKNTGLVLFDGQGNRRLELRVMGGASPRLEMNGPDGGNLVSLGVVRSGKPQLIMSERDFNGRVVLGIHEPDSGSAGTADDTWVLRFRGDRGEPLAAVGMRAGGAGGVVVRDQSGRQWRTPLKEPDEP